jgi:hypothetical protein
MTDYLFCKFFERGEGVTLSARGDTFTCESASGAEFVNMIGNGKVTIPAYDNMSRTALEQVQRGDICVCWTTAPRGTDFAPLHVCTFIVETRQYKKGVYEMSGPDLLGELTEYLCIAPVGQGTEVIATALSMGTRTVNHPPPEDDTYEELEAMYPARKYITLEVAGPHQNGTPGFSILFTTTINAQETDTITITFEDGEVFTSAVTEVGERMENIKVADPIPQSLPVGSVVYFHSTRLRVSDASDFVEGARIFYTPIPGIGKRPQGNFIIDRIIAAEPGSGDPSYVFSADPITDGIYADTGVTQIVYTTPTTGDIQLLLEQSTFDEWSYLRSVSATTGTSYAPNDESVWDVLLAITDITGYKVRRYFRGWEVGESIFFPLRRLEYFPAQLPIFAGDLTELGTETRFATDYGEILNLETEDVSGIITHLVPYGGGAGSGRFDFRTAAIGTVLEDYPEIEWGIVNGHYYIYNNEIEGHAVWAAQTFSQISPLDPTDYISRKEAAEQLLVAACEWLRERATTDVTYNVEIFTLGEPRPGDVIDVDFSGAEPDAITATTMTISEVHHEVTADPGYRVTRLILNRRGVHQNGGPQSMGRILLDLQRTLKQANFGARGDAFVSYDTVSFGSGGIVQAQTGNLTVRSVTGDVTITSIAGEVNINGTRTNVSGSLYTTGEIRGDDGLVLKVAEQAEDVVMTTIIVRGVPRLMVRRRAR